MRRIVIAHLLAVLALSPVVCAPSQSPSATREGQAVVVLHWPRRAAANRALKLDNLFYETSQGRVSLPVDLTADSRGLAPITRRAKMADGRTVELSVIPAGRNVTIHLRARPGAGILKWGLAVDANSDEYYTGLMERVVDGPQQASWSPGLKTGMNLRGQKVDMIVKPTTSVYAPFYLSSRGYGVFVQGNWPGYFDFCVDDPQRVKIEFEGPSFALKVYTAEQPAQIVRQHALDAGPPFMPPRWMFTPWRWRDEHTQRAAYYDGTPVTGPFNSEAMEDVLMMQAYGIPCGVYWIDRPWGPGAWGYDDFEIDEQRLPNFAAMVNWLNENRMQMLLWIAPFFQGKMAAEATVQGYTLAGQERPRNGNNYPMVDLTNPQARAYWQAGVAKLLKLGVAAFKLDRAEEDIPESGLYKVFDGRSMRENRNAYPAMYIKAAYAIARRYRANDFVLMPRAAYTGSSPFGVFWGGDIGGTQEGLRASMIAVQRAAVMGYPNWGSDTCGYNQQLMEQEVCGRWLAFSCFTPIMEVGPTKNLAFWNLPREPSYDAELIALWRLYARLHQRLSNYGYAAARVAHLTGMPIVRPLFLVDPQAKQAWTNWWTYLYGPDLLVSPVWEKGQREQEVYLPAGRQWRDAWNPDNVYDGGQTLTVRAEPHQIPLFIRVGSKLSLGDLNQAYKESVAIAQKRPDLQRLETEVKAWFARNRKK